MSDDIVARLRGLATTGRPGQVITRERYRLATPIDDCRARKHMTGAELLPVVSEAFELAGLSHVRAGRLGASHVSGDEPGRRTGRPAVACPAPAVLASDPFG